MNDVGLPTASNRSKSRLLLGNASCATMNSWLVRRHVLAHTADNMLTTCASTSQVFDQFMQKRFPQTKRYGLEGAESMLVALDQLFSEANHGKSAR